MLLNWGAGCPVAGAIWRTSGNFPFVPPVNDPLRAAFEDGVPAPLGGVELLNEFTSAVPVRAETPSESTCPAKASKPCDVFARKFDAYFPLKAETGIGAVNVCGRATPAPEGPEVPVAPPSSSKRKSPWST